MLWTAWTSLIPTLLIVTAVVSWWFTEPKNARINLTVTVGIVLFCWAVAPELSHELSAWLYSATANTLGPLHIEVLVLNNVNMILTGAAIVWLVRRAWQTLWKPVPDLINILGVEVPDPPDIVLAGIRSDAATLNWTKPPANRPVQKFLIQVNGVVVGHVPATQDAAIVVSGLKPDHFYNIRVIAVGFNNFQAGSKVLRLRTFGQDGRPQLGNNRLPASFALEQHHIPVPGDDEDGVPHSPVASSETAANSEPIPPLSLEGSLNAGSGPRRNTTSRCHSSSTASLEPPSIPDILPNLPEESLPELTGKFEAIRLETEETLLLFSKEEAEHKKLMDELEAEKQGRKTEQKKKEEQTERLKKEVNKTERSMRNAMQLKAQKEKQLKDRRSERAKLYDNVLKWEKGIDEMRKSQDGFARQKKELEEDRDKKAERFYESNAELQAECSRLENELREKREQVKELEDARKRLPGGEYDEHWREMDADFFKELQSKRRELTEELQAETRMSRRLEEQMRTLASRIQHIPTCSGLYSQANSSGVDIENVTVGQLKRRSRASNSISEVSIPSPLPDCSQIDPVQSAPPGFVNARGTNVPPGFSPGPFRDLNTQVSPRLDEQGLRAFQAPLSPSAEALLPSNILYDLDDDDEPSPSLMLSDLSGPRLQASPENGPQSPAASAQSPSPVSSPHGSAPNLPFPAFPQDEGTAISGPPTATHVAPHKFGNLFSLKGRPSKNASEHGPPLGSLKLGHSQSFPRSTDDPDASKLRKSISTSWNVFNRISTGPEMAGGITPASASKAFSARNLFAFSGLQRNSNGIFAERHPSSPRPASIASSELPRPSTDSGSIWGPHNSSNANRYWAPNITWSRATSRRASLHGSLSTLTTTLASAEDEILEEHVLSNVSQVGVIGSRPCAQQNKLGRLNPNAPAFIGSFFKSKADKDLKESKDTKDAKDAKESKEANRDKSKGKDKTKSKDKGKDKSKFKEPLTPETPHAPSIEIESPNNSHVSRDAYSMHTQTSISESRESLPLDQSISSTSEALSAANENVVRKLFRKGSSSKFNLPGRLGGKKGPGSTASATNSDKGPSLECSSIGDHEEVADEVTALVRSYDSVGSSSSLGPLSNVSKGKESKTSVRWLSTFGKKGKRDKESLDPDRERVLEHADVNGE